MRLTGQRKLDLETMGIKVLTDKVRRTRRGLAAVDGHYSLTMTKSFVFINLEISA